MTDWSPAATLQLDGFAPGAFVVIHWHGQEAVSQPYRFELVMAARSAGPAPEALLGVPARLCLALPDGAQRLYHGVIRRAGQLDDRQGYACYEVELVPRIALLGNWRESDIYLDMSLPELIRAVLSRCGLGVEGRAGASGAASGRHDFRLALTGPAAQLPPASFICQFDETCLDFLARRLEREGVYYHFEQAADHERVIFCDAAVNQPELRMPLSYRPPGTHESASSVAVVEQFSRTVELAPHAVSLNDFAGSRAALGLRVSEPVTRPSPGASGRAAPRTVGEHSLYGKHYDTEQEGRRLARLAADSLACAAQRCTGRSRVAALAAGHRAELRDHPHASLNGNYYVLEVRHEGWQPLPGAREVAGGSGTKSLHGYRNEFAMLPGALPYSPMCHTPCPCVTQPVSGIIDAEGDGAQAQLNENGCYKVRFPFARADRPALRASAWVRFASPYAGERHGMHFPLLKGTEVLVAFLNGDPDRPIIIGALANSEHSNVVVAANVAQNVIRTAGGNGIVLDDTHGSQSVHLSSPVANSSIRLGTAASAGLALASDQHIDMRSTSYSHTVPGVYSETIMGGAPAKDPAIDSAADFGLAGNSGKGAIQASHAMGVVLKHIVGVNVTATEAMAITLTNSLALDMGMSASWQIKKGKVNEVFKDKDVIGMDQTTTFVNRTEHGVSDKKEMARIQYDTTEFKVAASSGTSFEMSPAAATLAAGHASLALSDLGKAALQATEVALSSTTDMALQSQQLSIEAAELGVKAKGRAQLAAPVVSIDADVSLALNGQLISLG